MPGPWVQDCLLTEAWPLLAGHMWLASACLGNPNRTGSHSLHFSLTKSITKASKTDHVKHWRHPGTKWLQYSCGYNIIFLWPGAWAGNCLQPLRQIQWLHLSPGMPMSIDFRVFVYIQPGPSDIDENLLLGIAPQWNTASWDMFEQSKPNMGYYVACWAFWVRLLRHFLCFLMKILMQITTN